MEIITVTSIDDKITEAITYLLPQLTGSTQIPSKEYLEEMINSGTTTLFIAKENNKTLGMLSLVTYPVLSGRKAWIEDVITDTYARGKGVGKQLVEFALNFAKEQNIEKVDLTSSDHRIVAHKLYEKTGFVKRETSVFRINLKDESNK